MPRSIAGLIRLLPAVRHTMFWGVDYVHNEGQGWLATTLNPGLRVNTTRTGAIIRTDLLGLANRLGIRRLPTVLCRDSSYDGRTHYDGLSLQLERRFSGFWGARASYTLGHARGNNSGAPERRQQLSASRREESRTWRGTARHRSPAQPHVERPSRSARS